MNRSTIVATAMALGAAVALAQTPTPPPQTAAPAATPAPQAADNQRPAFRTEANYIRVDAYPTRAGAPVTDLAREDFEILEDGKPQRLEQFERVEVRGSVPEAVRIEPNTVRESSAMAETTRGRIFVVYLDTYHVSVASSHRIRQPLITALNDLIGPDDLVGFMTPEMSPRDIAFARKTTTIEGMLTRYWPWGERDNLIVPDPEDKELEMCYPGRGPTRCADGTVDDDTGVAAKLIARRHEHLTLNALHNLMLYLRGVREERKAVIAITEGWLQYGQDPSLLRKLNCQLPTPSAPGVIPGTGRIGASSRDSRETGPLDTCEILRQALAWVDDQQLFRALIDEANGANASFYPLDPRGLPVFDTSIANPAPPILDRAMLQTRLASLQTLADNTDGLAMVNSNDLNRSFKKIVADLSAYYLLGYYSSGKLDGRFHAITVRVKRPGVQVRARRGYLAATADEAARSTKTARAESPPTPAEAEAMAIDSVLQPLASFSRETSLRLRAAAAWAADGKPRIWVVGEIGTADAWKAGADAEIQLTQENLALATAHAAVPAGARTFKLLLEPSKPLQPGNYSITVQTRAKSLLATSSDLIPLPLPPAPAALGSVIVRKGPFTGLKEVPTADLRFRRSEQMRVEVPAPIDSGAIAARLLDRTGKVMTGVPVTGTVREDPDGSRWLVAQVPLFPLGPGDYIVDVTAGSVKTLTPFRIVQ